MVQFNNMKDINDAEKKNIIYEKKTPYGKLQVADTILDDEAVSFLLVDGQMESAMYLAENRKYDLIFPYMEKISYAFAVNPDIHDVFLIGGGGFSYPKYYLHRYKTRDITVAEISQDVIDVSYRYFGLDELDIEKKSHLHIIQEDGFQWMREHPHQFDLIINDAFKGNTEIGRTQEDIELMKEHLQEDGILMINGISAVRGFHAHAGKKLNALLKKYFQNTALIKCDEDLPDNEQQNILFTASDSELL